MAWVVDLAKQYFPTPSQTAQYNLSYELADEQRQDDYLLKGLERIR
jgi:hypothetical protein